MDIQRSTVDRIPSSPSLLPKLSAAITAARRAEIPVLYVVVRFRPGSQEINPRNFSFSRIPQGKGFIEGDPGAEIHPDVAPHAGDAIITKRRVSAFTGSDLEVVLRSLGAENLVLTGISTSGVVLSTLRQAADIGLSHHSSGRSMCGYRSGSPQDVDPEDFPEAGDRDLG